MRRTRYQRGYVFLKAKSWFLRYREYDASDVPIQRCRKLCDAVGEFRSKTAAKKLAEEVLKPLNDGTFTPGNAASVDSFIETVYLPFVEQQKRPSTYNGYKKIWKRYLKSRCGRALRDFRTVDCDKLLNAIARDYDVSRTTLAHVKHMLSGVFRYAARTGVLNAPNPIRDACLPPARSSPETHAYSLNEIVRMLAALPEPANTVVALAAFTGLRRGEIRGLRCEDYSNGLLKVQRSIWRSYVGDPKGKRGKGAVPVISPLAALLDSYLVRFAPQEYLFESMKGGPADLDYLSREVIAPKLNEHGMQWYGWHAFRRGLATNLHELGVSDIVIQAILRHSNVEVTREAYIKRNGVDSRSMAAMKALENVVCNYCASNAVTVQPRFVVNY